MGPPVCVAITSCDFFEYTAAAVRTCFVHTPDVTVVVIDDASAGWPAHGNPPELRHFDKDFPGRFMTVRFAKRFGLNRSLNRGLEAARWLEAGYAVLANNDVLFTPGWFEPLQHALDHGYDLVGPVTNAPGPTAKGLQDVRRWHDDYRLTDDETYLTCLAADLRRDHGLAAVETRVNGFCFAATTAGWWAHAYDAEHDLVFRLANEFNSRGQRNPTPTMTMHEDEYQARLYRQGGKAAVCPGSFVMHYRSVWRGDRYKKGQQWLRRGDSHDDCDLRSLRPE